MTRAANNASGYDWSVTFLTDVEPSAFSDRMMVSYNGMVGNLEGGVTAEVSYARPSRFRLLLMFLQGGERTYNGCIGTERAILHMKRGRERPLKRYPLGF